MMRVMPTEPLVFHSAHSVWFRVRNEFPLSPERTWDTAEVLKRGEFCGDCVQEGPEVDGKTRG